MEFIRFWKKNLDLLYGKLTDIAIPKQRRLDIVLQRLQ